MRIDIISGLPKLLSSPLNNSIIKRAKIKKKVIIRVHDLRKYTHDRHHTIDDTPYGGGAGMILRAEPIFECIENLQKRRKYDEVIYLTADGEKLNQNIANELSLKENIILLGGHYKGIDERVRQSLITREISIGDYVLTGGELPSVVVVDAVVRLLPGVVGDGESMLNDSFQDGLLDAPFYTKPPEYRGLRVPEVLLSGNHKEIDRWRNERRLEKTKLRRPDLLKH
jgi:tRNA (guanine37-N1)-methyltransferase